MDEPHSTELRRLHNVRNHLSVIIGYCDLLLGELADNDRRRADVLEMRKAAISAMNLLQEPTDVR